MWIFGVLGTASFAILGIMSGLFPATLEKIRAKTNAIMETPSKTRRWFLACCYFALAAYCLSTSIVYLNSKATPVKDDAMRLVTALDMIGNKWTTNGLTASANIEHFIESEDGHWILRVHNELMEHFRESDSFDDVARRIDRMGARGIFTDATQPPTLVIFSIRDDIKRLAKPLKE